MNTELLEKLASLADELDIGGHEKFAIDVDNLLKELIKEVGAKAEKEEADIETNLTFCPTCNGTGEGKDEPWCHNCRGTGFVALKKASITKTAFIKKRNGKYCVVSHKNKPLGCYKTKAAAQKRLRQIEFWKRQ